MDALYKDPSSLSFLMSFMSQSAHSLIFNDLRWAAAIWDKFALVRRIDYAFIGSFAIQLITLAQCVKSIEILVHPNAIDDFLDSITFLNSNVLVKNSEGWIMNIGDEKFVTLQFVTTGSNNYPSEFMPPWGSPARDVPDFPSGPPNIFYLSLGFRPSDVVVPILLPKYMLRKSIFDLDTFPDPPDDNYRRCLDEIDLLLICAFKFRSCISFDLRGPLIPIIQQHLVHVSRRKSMWASLGFDLRFKLAEDTDPTTPSIVWVRERPGVVHVNPRLPTIEEREPIVWGHDSPENTCLTLTAFREYLVYSHILYPTREQIWDTIRRWDDIAKENLITYGLVGQVAAWLYGHDGIVFELEILMSEDGFEKLRSFAIKEMTNGRRRKVAITPTNRHILVIDHQSLVGVNNRFFTTGEGGYPAIMVTQNIAIPSGDGSDRNIPVLEKNKLLEQVKFELKMRENHRDEYATREENKYDFGQYEILRYRRRFWEGKKIQTKTKSRGRIKGYVPRKSGPPRPR